MTSFTPKFLDIPARQEGAGGHRLGYLEWADCRAEAPVVVCVHGLTRNAHDFDFLAAALAAEFRVLAVDMPGRGYSDWLENKAAYTYATYTADCRIFLDALGLSRVQWVGTSMGGIIGMMLASAQPERIRSLVLNDIGKRVPKAGFERIVLGLPEKTIFDSREEAELYLIEAVASFGIRDPMHWRRFAEHSIWEIRPGTFILARDPEILAPYREQTDNFTRIEDIDLAETWNAVTCPVLLLRGKESDILTEAVARDMIAEKPQARLVEFDRVGHAPALMDDAQIAVVREWLLSHT